MPSEEELSDYAKSLPEIYRDILAAYPDIDPSRSAGYGLAFQTLAMHFVNTRKQWSFGDVQSACMQLESHRLITIKNGIFAHPTELGEQLIALLTGKPPAPIAGVPLLPPPPSP